MIKRCLVVLLPPLMTFSVTFSPHDEQFSWQLGKELRLGWAAASCLDDSSEQAGTMEETWPHCNKQASG